MNSFIKQSSEEYGISIDLSNTFETSETISSIEVSVKDNSGNSAGSIISSSANDDDTITIVVTGGSNETIYKITTVITSSLGYTYEEDVYMEVIDF